MAGRGGMTRCAGSSNFSLGSQATAPTADGEIVECFGTAQDVPIHKKVEEPHKKSSHDVGGLVRSRRRREQGRSQEPAGPSAGSAPPTGLGASALPGGAKGPGVEPRDRYAVARRGAPHASGTADASDRAGDA